MKKLLISSAILFPMLSFAQPLHINLLGGFSNYQGDLQDKQFTMSQSNAAFGIGAEYDLSGHFSSRGGLLLGKVSSDDKKNTQADLVARNLSFKSNITEGNLLLVYNFLDIKRYRLTPYAFAGVAIYHFDPYTYDTLGHTFYLKNLSTEGQGLAAYPDRKAYKLTQFAAAFGGGFKFAVSSCTSISLEFSQRKTFTDYLDDVSTSYVDQNKLLAAKGQQAVNLAFRGDEVHSPQPYPPDGEQRGTPTEADWYYFVGITADIRISCLKEKLSGLFGGGSGGNSRFYKRCPTVY